jgi:hypothetical protein
MDEMVKTGEIRPGVTPERAAKLNKMHPVEVPVEEYLKRAGTQPSQVDRLDDDLTKRAADNIASKLK